MTSIEEILIKEANKSQMNKKYACAIFNNKGDIISLGHNDYSFQNTGQTKQCLLRV